MLKVTALFELGVIKRETESKLDKLCKAPCGYCMAQFKEYNDANLWNEKTHEEVYIELIEEKRQNTKEENISEKDGRKLVMLKRKKTKKIVK